ncbi:MAG: InlB B-repeat-containing protein [Oscillospiraceae bacterium]|nr:InlB B-repeat-containing protein [Oscillospiraceae bacterium]
MIKRKGIFKWISMILVVAYLLSTFALSVTAAPDTATVTVPAGQTSFSIELLVNESLPYSGIEFALTISGGSAPTFVSFIPTQSGASTSPFVTKSGLQYFGFYSPTGTNSFPSGESIAGILNFTGYTGNQAITVSVVQMDVTRIDMSKEPKETVTIRKASPAYVFTVQRESIAPTFYTVTFDPVGGTRTGGGALTQSVPEGGAAVAPTLTRSGFTFDSWDRTFSNITANITVAAQWTPSGPTNYTVTFDPAGGTHSGGGALVQEIPSGGAAVAPVLTRTGFTFNGWDRAFSNVTSDMTVTAQWTPGSGTNYTVTFDPAGGTRTGGGDLVQAVPAGGAAEAPVLIRSGYTFNGWDRTFNNVTANMTVTAQWTTGGPTYYTVTFITSGGTRTGGGELVQIVASGDAAVAPVLTRSGYTYSWDNVFDNVVSDITVTAIWSRTSGGGSNSNGGVVSATYYTVTFDPAGGTRTGGGALVQTVPAGRAATAPIVVRDGYSFNGWDNAFGNVITNITVTALWEDEMNLGDDELPFGAAKTHYFDDVTETLFSWALEAVDALAEAGVVKGTAYRIYSPAESIKRGDFILMLYRAYELNEPFTENFPDVPADTYYYDAIGSTKALGIARGYGDGQFLPEAPISREEMMALIDRTMDTIGKPLPRGTESDLAVFADQDTITDYARDSVAALVKTGIIIGDGVGINPLGHTTRAEMAVALYRLMILTGDL